MMKPYFVDKTKLLSELFPFLEVGNTHICITRPRRFGKTMIANMIASFLGKRKSENGLFESLNISQNKEYIKYKNQYDVIFIDFSKMPRECHSYREYIDRIEENLIRDLYSCLTSGILFSIRILLKRKIKSNIFYF